MRVPSWSKTTSPTSATTSRPRSRSSRTSHRLRRGSEVPRAYGSPQPNQSLIPEIDEITEAESADLAWPSPLEVYPVEDPRQIVRAEPQDAPLVVDGDAEGISAAADVGLLAGNPTILYATTLDSRAGAIQQAGASGATLVLTDTDRKREFRWNSVAQNAGYTETAAQTPPDDPTAEPIDSFLPQTTGFADRHRIRGDQVRHASDYGNDVQFLPEDRAAMALDGDTQTSWQTSAFSNPVGQWWQVALDHPTTTDHINLLQVITGIAHPLDHERDPHLRREKDDSRVIGAGIAFAVGQGPDLDLPDDHLPDASHHHRRHQPQSGREYGEPSGSRVRRGADSRRDDAANTSHSPKTCSACSEAPRSTTGSSSSSRACGSLPSRRGPIRRRACRGSSGCRQHAISL